MIKEVEAGVGSVDQGETSTLQSKYKATKNVEWELNSPSAKIVESTPRTCVVESVNAGSIAFKLNGHTFSHVRKVIPSRGRTDINNIEPTVKPSVSQYKYVEQPALRELI